MLKQALMQSVGIGALTLGVAIAAPAVMNRDFGNPASAAIAQSSEARSLLDRGRTVAATGRFDEAVQLWQQAATTARQQGDSLAATLSLSYLSHAYLQLGDLQRATDAIAESKTLLNTLSGQSGSQPILAQVLNTEGNLLLAAGNTQAALETWERAEKAYRDAADELGAIGVTINQAEALQALGLYRRSRLILERVRETLQSQRNREISATGLRSLGIALQAIGDLDAAETELQNSLTIAKQLESPTEIGATLYSLGNIALAKSDFETAIAYYQQAAATATTPLERTEAAIGEFNSSLLAQQEERAAELLPQIQDNLARLTPSRMSVYARVNLAETLIQNLATAVNLPAVETAAQQLAIAVQQARELQDLRAEAIALGELGKLYQITGQLQAAQNLSQQAIALAETINADEVEARSQAQLGEVLQQQGKDKEAIAAYSEAVTNFNALRRDLVAIDPDVQYSFRKSVEPVYRELVGLLLKQPGQKELKQARDLIEGLQLAELDNFFREACLDAQPKQIDRVDTTAAVIYPIILRDRLAVILSLPGQPLQHYTTNLPQEEIESTLRRSRQALSLSFSKSDRLQVYGTLYDWLIRPAETAIAESGVSTLVFVLDGALRSLPMAALYDGEGYLIQRYGIALTPGLQLLDPQPLENQALTTLIAGLSEARQGFSALPAVRTEVSNIATSVGSEALLLDAEFTTDALQQAIAKAPIPVVHLATHAQFSSNAKETYILTWDGKIDVSELGTLLGANSSQGAIELLVLSACQTAKGDDRAELGLAGVAVKSGARSTLATLWTVRDASTAELMTEFYTQLRTPGISKAEALRQAQLSLIQQPQYENPFYWAPFVLVGNWL